MVQFLAHLVPKFQSTYKTKKYLTNLALLKIKTILKSDHSGLKISLVFRILRKAFPLNRFKT